VFLAASLVVFGCQQGGGPTAPRMAEQSGSIELVTGASKAKAEICHLDDEGEFFIISVADPAVPGHLGHGDHLVTAEVCGDGIDNNCDGQVDEGCAAVSCPCGTAESIQALNLDSRHQCTEVGDVLTFGGGGGFLEGVATSSTESGNTSCTFSSIFTGTTSSTGHSQEEAQACHDLIRAYAADEFVNCS
jgi:hypothetical protein